MSCLSWSFSKDTGDRGAIDLNMLTIALPTTQNRARADTSAIMANRVCQGKCPRDSLRLTKDHGGDGVLEILKDLH